MEQVFRFLRGVTFLGSHELDFLYLGSITIKAEVRFEEDKWL
jgi:hypothetical protein